MDTRWRNTQDSIQTYFKEYEAHFLDFKNRTQSEELFSELMKSDLKFCLDVFSYLAMLFFTFADKEWYKQCFRKFIHKNLVN